MGSRTSFLEIINETENDIILITVDETDNYDWDGNSRPDHNFNGVTLSKHKSKKEQEELNSNAQSAWFRMHILLSNGDKISFKNDQKDAFSNIQRIYKLDGSKSQDYMVFQSNSGDEVNTFKIFPFSLKKWMKSIPDNTSLLNMSIPGTHDSCATEISEHFFDDLPDFVKGLIDDSLNITIGKFAQCQNWDLTEQLENGVRFLDIRAEAKERSTGDYLKLRHGFFELPMVFNDVLKEVIKFLKVNPSETILMQLKQESSNWDPIDYANLVQTYINNNAYKDYFLITDHIPTIGEARGKVVLINRFINSNDFGFSVNDWEDNASFSKKNNGIQYNVQDKYYVPSDSIEWCRDDKMNHVNYFFDKFAFQRDSLNLCFCSAVGLIDVNSAEDLLKIRPWALPITLAAGPNGVNERISKQHLQSKKSWNGVILFDFIDSYYFITIPYIVNNNFSK